MTIDIINVPLISASVTLRSAWGTMRARGSATILRPDASLYAAYSDHDLARGIAAGVETFDALTATPPRLAMISSEEFAAITSRYDSSTLETIERAIGARVPRLLGVTGDAFDVPNDLATRVVDVFAETGRDTAVVGVLFGTATLVSRSRELRERVGIFRAIPGRYHCTCHPEHVLEPYELHEGRCRIDGCAVEFRR